MTVTDHMHEELVTVSPEDSLLVVSRVLESRRVGSALVVQGGNLLGIVTERDIVRAVAMEADPTTHQAADFMSSMLTTIGADASMETAAQLMTNQRIRHLPVVDDARLIGILSIRDVAQWSLRETSHERDPHLPELMDLV